MYPCKQLIHGIQVKPSIKAHNGLTINDFQIKYYNSICEIMTENSSALSDSDDFFLNANYLQFIENNPPKDFTFCYLTFEQNHRMVGFMACQIKYFSAAQSLNFEQNENKSLPFKKWLAEKVAYNTLIVGNLMLTGDHSFFFKKDTLNFDEKKQLFTEGVNFAKQKLADQGTKINAVFIKDFELGSDNHRLIQSLEDYNEFQVEPNFVFNLRKEWQNFDDYLDALSSKYRVRAKRAFKKRQTLEFKEFNVERIIAYKDRIYTLYEQVCSNSAVNLIQLNPNYFVNLKNEFEDDFKLFGYLKDNQLLGFFTTLRNGEELEAHFLGYEMSQNAPYQIYLNMLFEIVKQGIDTRVKRIVFARTAHEIKSSIGAEAIEMSLFFKHENCLFNHVLPLTLPILSPREKWTPRQPFK